MASGTGLSPLVDLPILRHLEVNFSKLDKDEIICSMPVSEKHVQVAGALHGGVSVLLAETAASVGAALNADLSSGRVPVGLEINANHISSAPRGSTVVATAKPLHRGRTTHVWEVFIRLQQPRGKLVCISRCTMSIPPVSADKSVAPKPSAKKESALPSAADLTPQATDNIHRPVLASKL